METSELHDLLGSELTPRGIEVVLIMPKFKIEFELDADLKFMKEFGVTKLFIPGQCDFNGFLSKVHALGAFLIRRFLVLMSEVALDPVHYCPCVLMLGENLT